MERLGVSSYGFVSAAALGGMPPPGPKAFFLDESSSAPFGDWGSAENVGRPGEVSLAPPCPELLSKMSERPSPLLLTLPALGALSLGHLLFNFEVTCALGSPLPGGHAAAEGLLPA